MKVYQGAALQYVYGRRKEKSLRCIIIFCEKHRLMTVNFKRASENTSIGPGSKLRLFAYSSSACRMHLADARCYRVLLAT